MGVSDKTRAQNLLAEMLVVQIRRYAILYRTEAVGAAFLIAIARFVRPVQEPGVTGIRFGQEAGAAFCHARV